MPINIKSLFTDYITGYYIDTMNCVIYINSFNEKILKINLTNGLALDSIDIPIASKYQIQKVEKFLFCKSNRSLIVMSNDLEIKGSYLDSVFRLKPELKETIYGYWDYKVSRSSVVLYVPVLPLGSTQIRQDTFKFELPNNY